MILAIETATDVCSVAFENETDEVFEERTESRGSHSEKLFLFIRALMEEHQFVINDLEAILVSEGPGSYTGLRIAASGVKGLLFGSDVRLYGVQTLASFAMAAYKKVPSVSSIHAIIDARRKHLYHQKFSITDGAIEADKKAEVVEIETFEKMVQLQDVIIGTGGNRLDKKFVNDNTCLGREQISAQSLIQLYQLPKADTFMEQVEAAAFDPKYYTSNQV